MADSDDQLTLNGELFQAIRKTKIEHELRRNNVEKCLQNGAQVDAQDQNNNNNSALHIAVKKNYPEIVELLLENGANADIRNNDGKTPLDLAIKLDYIAIIGLLQAKKTPESSQGIKRKLPQDDNEEPSNVTTSVKKPATSHKIKRKQSQDDTKGIFHADYSIKKPKINEQDQQTDPGDKYSSNIGLKSTLHGVVYQLKLSLLFLMRALYSEYSFELATEMNSAEKFDDLVIIYKKMGNTTIRFLQAKHKQSENKKIKYSDLSTNRLKGEFCLNKYFRSYCKIKQKPEFKDKSMEYILCTNIDFDFKDLKRNGITTIEMTEPDDFLDVKTEKKSSRYKLLISKDNELFEKLKIDNKVEDSEILEFFSKLVFAINQPSEEELGSIISKELGEKLNLTDAGLINSSLLEKVLDWMKKKDGLFLTNEKADKFVREGKEKISTLVLIGTKSEYCKKIRSSLICFKTIPKELTSFLTTTAKQIFNYVSEQSTKILAIKVDQAIQMIEIYKKQDSFIFINSSSLERLQQSVLEAFNSSESNNLLVIEYKTLPQEGSGLINRFLEVLNKNNNKKIILLTNKELKINNQEDKLERIVDTTDFSHFTSETQTRLLSRNILFQNKQISFNSLIDNETAEELIDTETLLNFVHEEEIKIENGSNINIECLDNCYIDRQFNRCTGISTRIFQDKKFQEEYNKIIFAIEGISKETLLSFKIKDEQIFIEDCPDNGKISHFFILDNQKAEQQFTELCRKFKDYKIHHLFWKGYENLVWKKSHGSISDLLPYVRSDLTDQKDSYSEGAYLQQKLLNRGDFNEDVSIIADSAGMGKSSILGRLEKLLKETRPHLWVIRMELNNYTIEFSKELERRKGGQLGFSGSTNAIEFLLNDLLKYRLKTTLEKVLFKHSLLKHPDKTIVMLDGFDEISPDYKEIVFDLLDALNETGCKLLVTTRPSMRPDLEERLNRFAYTLEPFSEDDQKDFLVKFWKKRLRVANEEEKALKVYASKLNDKFRRSISDKEKRFLGIPLQLRMLTEIFQENTTGNSEDWQGCQEFIESYKDGEEPRLDKKIELSNLYERFVEKKFYDPFWADKGSLNNTNLIVKEVADREYRNFKKEHALLSLHRLLSDEDLNKLLNSSEIKKIDRCIKDIKNGKNRIGIIDSMIDDKPHFIHLTFAEYLAPIYFAKKMFINPEIAFQLINNIIINTSPVFIYCLTKEMSKKESELKNLLQGKTLVNYLIQNGYYDFATVLLESGYEDYPQPDIHNETPLHYSVKSGNLKLVRIVLNRYYHIYKKDILKQDELKYWYIDSDLVKFVNQRDQDNKTAIFYAAKIACEQEPKEYMEEITCELLRRGADDNEIKEYIKTIKFENNYSDAYYRRGDLQKDLGHCNEAMADFTKAIELNSTNELAYYMRGDLQEQLRYYNEAIADFTMAIKLECISDAYHRRGDLQKKLGNYNEAIADYTKAIELDGVELEPTDIVYYKIGNLQKKLGNYNEAIATYTKAIELDPTDENAYYMRGDLQKELGNYNEAMADYTKAIELEPNIDIFYYERGYLQKKLGNYNEAMADYTKAIELEPTYAYAYYSRGDLQKELGNYNEAMADITKVIKLKPTNANAYYMRGELQKELGNYNEAMADITKVIKLKPTNTDAYYMRGELQKELRNYNEAMADITKVIELDPTYANAYYIRELQKELGNYNKAMADYAKSIELNPTDADAYYMRGELQKELGNYNEAMADITKVIKLDPTYANAYYMRGDLQKELGNYNEAMADITKVIELKPTDSDAYYMRGELQEELGNYNEAMADITKVIELDPTYANAYYMRGDLQKELGNYNEAMADYTKSIELNPTDADAYYMRGELQKELGNYNEAMADITKVIELDPTYANAYYMRGDLQKELGNYNEAMADITKVIELKPTDSDAYYMRGELQEELGNYNEAMVDNTKAIELDPTYANAYYMRGDLQKELGNYNKAMADYTKSIELNPTDADAYYRKGDLQKELGNYNEAMADYTKAIELEPTYAYAYYSRGDLQKELGNYNEAMADITKVIKLKPTDANAYYMRGELQKELGNYNEAMADITKVIELDPTYANAYYMRGDLQKELNF